MATRVARFDMRLSEDNKELLEQAAAATGQDLTSFALGVLLEKAEEVLTRHRVTQLTRRDMRRFARLLARPPAPRPALKRAFGRLKDFRE